MKKSINLLRMFGLIIIIVSFVSIAYAGKKKVTICHYPPGNPNNSHTITVSEKALRAHLAHGDVIGECPTGCQADNECDDGNLCTDDICLPGGECENPPVDCDDGNPCTSNDCDPTIGCLSTPVNGEECDDGNDCTEGDVCTGSVCQGIAISGCCLSNSACDDGDPCTDDYCVDQSCENVPKDCSVADKCSVGVCDGATGECTTAPVSCNDNNACTDDSCIPDTGACIFNPATGETCDTGDLCIGHGLGICDEAGACVAEPVNCDDGNQCTTDSCNPGTGICEYLPAWGGCDVSDPGSAARGASAMERESASRTATAMIGMRTSSSTPHKISMTMFGSVHPVIW